MEGVFQNCESLEFLPDISEWNVNKVLDIQNLFNGCSSLLKIPDISKWNIGELCAIKGLFYGCSSVMIFPDISKWKLSPIYRDEDIFDSQQLKSKIAQNIDSIISEKSSKNEYKNDFFENCLPLISSFSNKKTNKNILLDKIDDPYKLFTTQISSLEIPKDVFGYYLNKEKFLQYSAIFLAIHTIYNKDFPKLCEQINNQNNEPNSQESHLSISSNNLEQKSSESVKYDIINEDNNFEENNNNSELDLDNYYENFYN